MRITDKNEAGLVSQLEKQIPEFSYFHTEEEIKKRLEERDHFIIIVEYPLPVGFYVCYERREYIESLRHNSYYLWLAGILPSARRTSLHDEAMDLCEEIARERGFLEFAVKTFEHFPAMIHSLRSRGFERFYEQNAGLYFAKSLHQNTSTSSVLR